MAGAGSGTIEFLSLRTGSDDSEIPIGGGSNTIGDLNEPPLNGGGLSFIGDLNDPPSSEIQKMMRELEQLRKEKEKREARRKKRKEEDYESDSDSSEDERDKGRRAEKEAGNHGEGKVGSSRVKKSKNSEWREKIVRMMEQCTQAGPREIVAEIARNVRKSSFTDDVLEAIKPRRFVTPTFQKYDGSTDPIDHIKGYKQQMSVETTDEKLICKLFPSSLTGPASTWFQDLKPQSIANFDTLSRIFISQYFCSRK